MFNPGMQFVRHFEIKLSKFRVKWTWEGFIVEVGKALKIKVSGAALDGLWTSSDSAARVGQRLGLSSQ